LPAAERADPLAGAGVFLRQCYGAEAIMALPIEDTRLLRQALAYVIELYRELTAENGAPTLGTQNQAVDFIVADPELRRAVTAWAQTTEIDEATTTSPRRLPRDALYDRARAYLEQIMARPVFTAAPPSRP
jgi:hypothetical protein